ncbi:unnamed protein product [Paramecium octaurelia]|uniref:Uncharacterized protein n=1 Tax=Paramecium octaurelia TaxID=43137 RepID=A0A8S1UA01_PAROT|nr:unnamed protein product [Paramecium octaurelia]
MLVQVKEVYLHVVIIMIEPQQVYQIVIRCDMSTLAYLLKLELTCYMKNLANYRDLTICLLQKNTISSKQITLFQQLICNYDIENKGNICPYQF